MLHLVIFLNISFIYNPYFFLKSVFNLIIPYLFNFERFTPKISLEKAEKKSASHVGLLITDVL